jgi:hypothetical protein
MEGKMKSNYFFWGSRFITRSFLILPYLLFTLLQGSSNSQNWHSIGTGSNNNVRSLTVFGGEIIAAGDFTSMGGISANRIARTNGISWQPLGLGTNGRIWAMAVFNGELIVAGDFTQVGGVSASRIAKWNGANWLLFGGNSSVNGDIRAMAVYNNQLYIAGEFTSIGGSTRNRIARWDGSSWQSVGLGLSDYATSLAVFGGELVVGGNFTTAGGINANRVAKWNGSSWSALGLGTNNTVHALAVVSSELIIGGSFTQVGGVGVNRIAKWTGSWGNFGTGTNGTVYAVTAFSGGFIAGGSFTSAGGVGANRIARWNSGNNSWTNLGTGMSGGDPIVVYSLAVYGTLPYAGGDFSNAGGVAVNNIARWGSMVGINQTGTEIPAEFGLSQNYPNPFNPSTKIAFKLPSQEKATLKIFDVTGRVVAEPVNEELQPGNYEINFDAERLSSGTYYYTLTAGSYRETKKMILIK